MCVCAKAVPFKVQELFFYLKTKTKKKTLKITYLHLHPWGKNHQYKVSFTIVEKEKKICLPYTHQRLNN